MSNLSPDFAEGGVPTSAREYFQQTVERHISRQGLVVDEDKRIAEKMVPALYDQTKGRLLKSGIDLDGLWNEGYAPMMAGCGHLFALPAEEDEGYLLVESCEEAMRPRRSTAIPSQKYPVIKGRVNPQVFLQWEDDKESEFGGAWALVDQRNGQMSKQVFRPQVTVRKPFPENNPGEISWTHQPARLDGKRIPGPFVWTGYAMSLPSEQIYGKRSSVSIGPFGTVKKLL